MTKLPAIGEARLGDHLDCVSMFTFFAAFSRFEYALKSVGLRMAPRNTSDAAEPDWDRFASTISADFKARLNADESLRTAVDELVKEPPKKQLHDLSWVDVPPQGDACGAHNVILIARRVRNNLFHGGKAERQTSDVVRDNQLVEYTLVVLDRALACHDGVRTRFVEA
ncbi:MAG: hypothetical protein ACHREM_18435 [Polyangiales bacterium]